MPEEATTPDLVALTRGAFDAASRRDLDAAMSFLAPDAVWDLTDGGVGTFKGVAAIKSFLEDWWATWGELLVEVEEMVDLGQGAVFASVREDARLAGTDDHVEQRTGWVFLWTDGTADWVAIYLDIDKERVTAERLAESRG